MNSPFKIGDRVRIIKAPYFPELLGAHATVTSELMMGTNVRSKSLVWGHTLDIDGHGSTDPQGNTWAGPPTSLEPLGDDRQLGAWSELDKIWQPQRNNVHG